MLTRSAFALLLFLFSSLYLIACNCINVHIPLEDMICYADTTGGLVLELEMTIRIDNNQQARFRVVNTHVGSTELEEINLSGQTSCAWYMSDDRPGDRFLYFTHPDWLDGNEDELFSCAMNSNIYRMNRRGTRVEYPVGVNGRNTRLAYRNFDSALGCAPGGIRVNPLETLILTNNPGSGATQLLAAAPELPEISSIEVYNSSGQLIRQMKPELLDSPDRIDIQNVPSGIYLVVVRQGEYFKALRYVRW
jgi:hypothetical protein